MNWYETYVDVAVSEQFLGWVFALGNNVKILSPESVTNQMNNLFIDRLENYK